MLEKTKEWHEARLKGIGGSEVSSVLSLPPYGCSRKLWYEKRETPPDFKPEINPAMQRGMWLEDIVREIYSRQALNRVDEVPAFASKEHSFMLGNIDGIISRPIKNDAGGMLSGYDLSDTGILEIKCPGIHNYKQITRNGIPESYLLQGAHYMYVADKQWMEYAIFCADMWELLVVPVKRDEELIKMIIEEEERFWIQVENGPTPERLEQGDKRCKKCNYKLTCWQELWKDDDEPEGVEDDYETLETEEFTTAFREHTESKELLSQAKEVFEESKTKLIDVIGEKEMVKCDLGKLQHKWQSANRLDTTKLKKDKPELYKEYTYKSGSNTFRVYPRKD